MWNTKNSPYVRNLEPKKTNYVLRWEVNVNRTTNSIQALPETR